MAKVYRKQVEELAALLQSEDDKQEAFEAIRGLVEQIVLSPEQGNPQSRPARGDRGHPKAGAGRQNPARDLAGRAEQLVMVAGRAGARSTRGGRTDTT